MLPAERGKEYLLRLAHNEPGLSRLLVRELRDIRGGQDTEPVATGEYVPFETLLEESTTIKARQEHEEQERKKEERRQHLQAIYDNWQQVEQATQRDTASGYDEAVNVLIDLRDAAAQFKASMEFQRHFQVWIQCHQRRPALFRRLQERKFPLPAK